MEATMGLLVRDSRPHEFATVAAIARHDSLLIRVPGDADLWQDSLRAMPGRRLA